MTTLASINRNHLERMRASMLAQKFRNEFDEARRLQVLAALKAEIEQTEAAKS